MNRFLIHKSVCKDIDTIKRDFFDNGDINSNNNVIHITWRGVCQPKCNDG